MRHLITALKEMYADPRREAYSAYGWTLERITRGMNGLVYKATSDDDAREPIMLKMNQRDDRRRTQREFAAMRGLWWSGIEDVSAYPLLIYEDVDDLPGDVLVSSWIEGDALDEFPPPEDKDGWLAILEAFKRMHDLTPRRANARLDHAVIHLVYPKDTLRYVKERRERLPATGALGFTSAKELDVLIAGVSSHIPDDWEHPPSMALTLCDSNPQNMIRTPNGEIRFVDWENSGWSDPAFDIADMLARQQGIDLPEDHRAWVRSTYAALVNAPHIVERIVFYERIFTLFWLILMTQGFALPVKNRLAMTQQFSAEHFVRYQEIYKKRIKSIFDL